jgi:hypothetical protein
MIISTSNELIKSNWRLRLFLEKSVADKVDLYTLEDPNIDSALKEKLTFVSERLGLSSFPTILVETGRIKKFNEHSDVSSPFYAAYNSRPDCVYLSKKACGDLKSGNPFAFYAIAHELGHRKDDNRLASKIKFGLLVGASFVSSLTAAAVTLSIIDAAKMLILSLLPSVVGAAAGITVYKFGDKFGIRSREFAADDNAQHVIGQLGCLRAIYQGSPSFLDWEKSRKRIQRKLIGENKNLRTNPEQLELAFYKYIASELPKRQLTLRDFLKNGAYPTRQERFKRIAKEVSP